MPLHVRILKWDLDLSDAIERLKQEEKIWGARRIRINGSDLIEVQGGPDVNNSQLQNAIQAALISFDGVRKSDFNIWVDRNSKVYPTVEPRS